MDYPPSHEVRTYESSFEAAHSEAREKGFNGSLVLRSDNGDGVVVYLDGWPIYGYHVNSTEAYGETAIESLIPETGLVDRHESNDETVDMFHTYMDYLGREQGLLDIAEKEECEVLERELLITVDDELTKIEVPAGRRIGYAPRPKYAEKYAEEHTLTGYALSNNDIIYFEDGRTVAHETFKEDGESMLARMESDRGLRGQECEYIKIFPEHNTSTAQVVNVEFDIDGWEIVETESGSAPKESEEKKGLIGRFIG